MARGKGVRLQRYKDGGLADAKVFALADGLSWGRIRRGASTLSRRRADGMDRPSRRGGAAAAEGVPEEQPVWGVTPSSDPR